MKLTTGSSPLFTVAIIALQDPDSNECDRRINALRSSLNLKTDFEFHFPKSVKYREVFLRTIEEIPFIFFSCTLFKHKLSGKDWHKKEYLYQRVAIMALNAALPSLSETRLWLDAGSSRQFDNDLLAHLRRHAGHRDGRPIIVATKRHESHKCNMIQMADMVCGAVHCSHRGEQESHKTLRRLLRRREGRVLKFPDG